MQGCNSAGVQQSRGTNEQGCSRAHVQQSRGETEQGCNRARATTELRVQQSMGATEQRGVQQSREGCNRAERGAMIGRVEGINL